MGLGEAVNDSKVIQLASDQLASIESTTPSDKSKKINRYF